MQDLTFKNTKHLLASFDAGYLIDLERYHISTTCNAASYYKSLAQHQVDSSVKYHADTLV